jgi:hypothetical protein
VDFISAAVILLLSLAFIVHLLLPYNVSVLEKLHDEEHLDLQISVNVRGF